MNIALGISGKTSIALEPQNHELNARNTLWIAKGWVEKLALRGA